MDVRAREDTRARGAGRGGGVRCLAELVELAWSGVRLFAFMLWARMRRAGGSRRGSAPTVAASVDDARDLT